MSFVKMLQVIFQLHMLLFAVKRHCHEEYGFIILGAKLCYRVRFNNKYWNWKHVAKFV